MSEKQKPSYVGTTPAGDFELGRIHLAPEVLEVIIGIATNEVEGVATTKGNFADDMVEKFGKVVHGKGVKTEWVDGELVIDIYCLVEYGFAVPHVAQNVQEHVRQSVYHMTSLDTKEVNIHITGIHFPTED